jgi:hypothetical protein
MPLFKTRAPKATPPREIDVEFDLGTTEDETLAIFGKTAVVLAGRAQIKVDVQALIRGMLEDGKNDVEIRAAVASWKPGMKVTRERVAKVLTPESFIAVFATMTPEEKKQYVLKLKGLLAEPAPTAK